MTRLIWDAVGDKTYETGLDRGVLYLDDGSGVPWNGLTQVIEHSNREISPVYFDGKIINNMVTLDDFSATLKAFTYPDEFLEYDGLGKIRSGVFVDEQLPNLFSLSYRTQIGKDDNYKIHIIYNIITVPNDKSYETISSDVNILEFEWEIVTISEEILNYYPSAHVVIDSSNVEPELLIEIEKFLYGDDENNPSLISLSELILFIKNWEFNVPMFKNKNDTFNLKSTSNVSISYLDGPDNTKFQVDNALNIEFLDESTYTITY